MTFKNKALDTYTTRDLPQGTNAGRPDFRDMPKCQARAKSTGEKCKNVAVKGKRVCYLHGGKSTGAKTERGKMLSKYARLRHGDYSAQVKENRMKLNALNRYFRRLGYLKQLRIQVKKFMGGYGSGRHFLQTKDKVGNGYSLDANAFTRWKYFKPGLRFGTLTWSRGGNQRGSCSFVVNIDGNDDSITFLYNYGGKPHPGVRVRLTWYHPGFDGRRYLFRCPRCGKRMRTLHIM